MTVDDQYQLREPIPSAVPNGQVTGALPDFGTWMADVAFFPFSLLTGPRLVNPGQISVASDSVATNNSPTFLSGFTREAGEIWDGTVGAGKKVTAGLGGVVTSLFPWWFWALLGVALLAYVVSVLAPALRRTP